MDEKIKIFIDESVILPENFIKKYNIGVIPIRIIDSRGEEWTFKKREEIIEAIKKGYIFRTSVPTPSSVIKILEKDKDKTILSFHVSSEISGIINVMHTVKRKFENLFIIDTETVGPVSGMCVLAALKSLFDGKDIKKIIEDSLEAGKNSLVYMAVPEALRLSRIRPVEGIKRFIQKPSLFIKFLRAPFGFPIITVKNNKLMIYDFSKSFEEASSKMIKGILDYLKEREGEIYAFLFYSKKNENTDKFKETILKEIKPSKFYEGSVPKVVLSAIGLNAFGIAVYKGRIKLIGGGENEGDLFKGI